MDLAAKRRQLEAIRLAREAKQRVVQQQQQQQQHLLQRRFSLTSSLSSSTRRENSVLGVDQVSEARAAEKSLTTSPQPQRPTHDQQPTGSSADGNHLQVSLRSVAPRRGNLCEVQVGVGAVALQPKEGVVSDCTPSRSLCADVSDGSLDAKMRLEGNPQSTSVPEAAMLLAHTLRAESVVKCRERSVLDVVVLGSSVSCGSAPGGGDCLLAAAALSEVHHVERTGDGVQNSVTSDSGDGLLSPSPSTTVEPVGVSKGLVLLWCIPLGKKDSVACNVVPLRFESEIRTLTYTRYRPHLLFGGAANGCIVVWCIDRALDKYRGNTSGSGSLLLSLSSSSPATFSAIAVAPIEVSFPSPHAHQSRVLGMAVHGDANYHHLYSISQDGRVCMWMPLHVRLPSSSRDGLLHGRPLGCTGSCAAFVDKAADAMSRVVVGCLDGHVLEGRTKSSRTVEMRSITASIGSPLQQKQQVLFSATSTSNMPHHKVQTPSSEGVALSAHHAAVVAVAPHPLHADPRISDTVLTASADGNCSLWLGSRRIAIEGFAAQVNCLRWSPTHPAVFVAGESNGRVAAWDLSQCTYSPVAFLYLRSLAAAAAAGDWTRSSSAACASNPPTYLSTAVTSLSFSEDGTSLACGTAAGEVHLLHLRTDLVVEKKRTGYQLDDTDGDDHLTSTAMGTSAANTAAAVDKNCPALSWIDARFAF